jgi:hypothetical protein
MADDRDRIKNGILGDINPVPSSGTQPKQKKAHDAGDEDQESMEGTSHHGDSHHSGSRDVTEGKTGGAEVGGSRNYRTGTGASGMDIGNRPE